MQEYILDMELNPSPCTACTDWECYRKIYNMINGSVSQVDQGQGRCLLYLCSALFVAGFLQLNTSSIFTCYRHKAHLQNLSVMPFVFLTLKMFPLTCLSRNKMK